MLPLKRVFPAETEEERKKRIREQFQERRAKEFFSIRPVSLPSPYVKSSRARIDSWLKMCGRAKLDYDAWMIEGNNTASLLFKNGLKISDYGYHVSFSAVTTKDKVDMKSALSVIKRVAAHLYQQGWTEGFEISAMRSGGTEMLAAFDEAYQKAGEAAAIKKVFITKERR